MLYSNAKIYQTQYTNFVPWELNQIYQTKSIEANVPNQNYNLNLAITIFEMLKTKPSLFNQTYKTNSINPNVENPNLQKIEVKTSPAQPQLVFGYFSGKEGGGFGLPNSKPRN